MADDVTLLPCKVCNSKRAVPVRYESRSYGPYWRVSCANCEYDGPARKTKEEAAAAWNARVPDPRVAELEAELAKSRAWRATLADTGDELLAELRDAQRRIAELEAELDALKARRCETCLWWKATKADYGVCTREPNIPAAWHRTDFCSWYEPAAQEAADAGMV